MFGLPIITVAQSETVVLLGLLACAFPYRLGIPLMVMLLYILAVK